MKCNDFFMLIRHVTLWRWPLARWPWKFVVDLVLRGHSLYYIWSKSNNHRLSYSQFGKLLLALGLAVTLTFDPLTLNFCGTSGVMRSKSVYKIWAKSNNSRQSYWPFSTFSPSNSREWVIFSGLFSGMCGPNFTKVGENTGRWWPSYEFVSELRYLILLHFQTPVPQSWATLKMTPNFAFWPPPVKIRGGVDGLSGQIVGASSTTEPPIYIWWPHSARLLNAVSLQKRKKKESTTVKLKASD